MTNSKKRKSPENSRCVDDIYRHVKESDTILLSRDGVSFYVNRATLMGQSETFQKLLETCREYEEIPLDFDSDAIQYWLLFFHGTSQTLVDNNLTYSDTIGSVMEICHRYDTAMVARRISKLIKKTPISIISDKILINMALYTMFKPNYMCYLFEELIERHKRNGILKKNLEIIESFVCSIDVRHVLHSSPIKMDDYICPN